MLELVDGETLAERLKRGKLSVAQAIQVSAQIAEALDAAHEKGIVHRDLKPANIKITSEGVVKVLDFGLAKSTLAGGEDTSAANRDGIVMGTAPYMSPEQARGLPVDKRTDIWAFGCVLFELLTGARAFRGESVTDILAAVINSEPDLAELPEAVTPGLRTLLTRCLQKDTKQRLRDIGDVRIELEMATTQAAAPTLAPLARRVLPWGLAGLGFALALALWAPWRKTAPPAPRHLETSIGADARLDINLGAAAILSPDGQTLAFLAWPSGGHRQLFLRPLNQLTATPLVGTDNALSPFFSPDGRWIAFFADGKLKKIPVTGGGAVTLCDVPIGRGGSWGDDGTIAFAPFNMPGTRLLRVSSDGGVPTPLTTLAEGEVIQRWPQLLPGGKAVLYTSSSVASNWDNATLVVQPLPTGPRKVVQRGGMYGRYLSSGHLVYVRGGTLVAVPFDLARLEAAGPPVAALEGVVFNSYTGGAQVAVSETGTLVYLRGKNEAPIVWIDRAGKTTPLRTTPANWFNPVFSPDGARLALQILDANEFDIWVYDWARDALSRLTSHAAGGAFNPVWTPDGRRIVFSSEGPEGIGLNWRRADGTGTVQRLIEAKGGTYSHPGSWHPSGKLLAFSEHHAQTDFDLMLVPLEGDEVSGWKPGTPTAFLNSPFWEWEPEFFPGRSLAGVSGERHRTLRSVRAAFSGAGREVAGFRRRGVHAEVVAQAPRAGVQRARLSTHGRGLHGGGRLVPRREAAALAGGPYRATACQPSILRPAPRRRAGRGRAV